ncbi:MAG TPA: hypothetical protein VFP40_00060 [Terriglobales bacterium]|nr:hypothetical protein [Terriglobales bacterium]
MSRLLSATLVLALATAPALAQRGGRGFGGGARMGHGPSVGFRSHSGFGFSGSHFGGGVVFRGPGFRGNHVHNFPRFHRPYLFYGYYGAYGYPSYAYYPYAFAYDSYYPSSVYDANSDRDYQQYRQLSNEVNDLSSEVRDLRDENDQLRYDLEKRRYAEVSQPPQTSPRAVPNSITAAPKTVLVFRDGRKQEVANYAIAGQTLWILSEKAAQKIALSELDIARTKAENEERGVEFGYGDAR